jgi:dethiobiotin synthetase
MKGFFVTATDTDAGKTYVALNLLTQLREQGHQTAALKPVAAGGKRTSENSVQNEDALLLQQAATLKFPYEHVNPIILAEPIAPEFSAARENRSLSVAEVLSACQPILQSAADYIVIEGAGGWQVPLNKKETMADLAIALNFPVIFIVGLRLGCLNHALLTAESLQKSQLPVAGWIANSLSSDLPAEREIINCLKERLPYDFLGHLAWNEQLKDIF